VSNRLFLELFKSSRPISWINTAYPFAAGYFLITRTVDLPLLVGSLYFLIPYNLMMYGVNDVFDYESDLRNPRKGGVEGAVLSPDLHTPILIAVVLTNAPFLVALFMIGSITAKLTLAFVVFMVIAYSIAKLRFKERPLLDSVTSSTHFVGPLVYALVLSGWHASYLWYVVPFFLWGMASHAFGAVQDVPSDRAANIASIATYFGARSTARFACLLYLLCAAILATRGLYGIVVSLCAILYATTVGRYWNITDKTSETAHNGWSRFLRLNQFSGFVITVVLIVTIRG
jgi:4-hydroxybenzoate polyprenyltransferase